MTALFVLADSRLKDAPALCEQVSRIIGERYRLETVASEEELHEQLQSQRQAVVLFSASPEHLPLTLQKIRAVLPSTACVFLSDTGDTANVPMLETDCLFLKAAPDDFSLLAGVAAAVRQSELRAAVDGSAQLDEVTNLYNRRFFLQRLSEEISLARRHLSPLVCVVVGINGYALYVDSFGHDFTNRLLRFVADKIVRTARHEDIVARVSDSEIAILLPRSTEKGARIFTTRLIQDLNGTLFRCDGYEEEISTCAGMAGYPLPDESHGDADTLIRYARHALHQARCNEEPDGVVQLFSEIEPAL